MNDISRALTRNDVRIAAATGLVVGGVSGYFVTRAVITKKIQEIADREIESVKEHYDRKAKLNKVGKYADISNLVDDEELDESEEDVVESVTEQKADGDHVAYDKIIKETGYNGDDEDVAQAITKVTERKEPIVKNVFKDPQPSIGQRDPEVPYLISTEEFMANDEFAFDQITLTYFEGDDTLTDEREDIVSDVVRTVGRDNLLRFGENSQDPNVVYVRNERLRSDFEIVRDPGKYSVNVLGMHDDAERNG